MGRSFRVTLVAATVASAVVPAGPARAEDPPSTPAPRLSPSIPSVGLAPTMLSDLLRVLDAPMQIVVPARFDDKHVRPPPSGAPDAWFSQPRGWFGAIAIRF